ncbi:MAG: phosphotransferase family protein [Candidatus Hodarchaeota archaeon]
MPFINKKIQNEFPGYLKTLFPSWRNLEIIELQKIDKGWETEKYSVSISYDGTKGKNQKDLFFRVFTDQSAAEHALREHRIMKKLSELDFPVPKIFGFEQTDGSLGAPFIIMQRIRGQSMMDLLVKASEEEQARLLSQFCEIWGRLHSLDWRKFLPDPTRVNVDDPQWYINNWLSEREEGLKRHHETHILLPILEWLKTRSSDVPCKYLSLVHRDYHPDNVLIAEDGAAYVIDWGAAGLEDFRDDLGWTLLLMTAYGYPVREVLLSEYQRLSGRKVEQIEFFEVTAALRRLSDLLISLAPTAGADTLGMRPEALDMMKQDAFHYKNVYSLLKEKTGLDLPELESVLSALS